MSVWVIACVGPCWSELGCVNLCWSELVYVGLSWSMLPYGISWDMSWSMSV